MAKKKTSPKKAAPTPGAVAEPNRKDLEIIVRGDPAVVRQALHEMQFQIGWDQGVARQIALDNAGVASATLDDELGGPKIAMFSEEVRLFYRDSCCREAAKLGHPVPDASKVESDGTTTVMTVGDTLYDAARP